MARTTLILAKSVTDANKYAKLVGLERFTYRAVQSAGSIRGVRSAEVHILPSFLARMDRHAIIAALRMARTLEIFYVDPADFADSETPAGPTLRELEVAHRYNGLRDAALEAAKTKVNISAVPDDVEPPASHTALVEAVKKRRTRCEKCSTLHFKDEACPTSATTTPATPATFF